MAILQVGFMPGHALCSWEQEIVTGGSCSTGYALASSRDITPRPRCR